MKLKIIDENSGNPFPHRISISSRLSSCMRYSTDGYSHNDQAVQDTTKKLAQIIGLTPGQGTIDVGYGSCLVVAATLKELGMDAYGLDSQDGLDKEKFGAPIFVPPHFNAEQNGVKKYCGTIEELLHPESELRDQRFDLFTFWGSWDVTGNSYTVGGEMAWLRAFEQVQAKYIKEINPHQYPYDMEINIIIQETKDKIFLDCISRLNPNGGILIVSSRYAYHGAGYSTAQLPEEKRMNLALVKRFKDLGAKEVCLIGLSKDKLARDMDPEELNKKVEDAICKSVSSDPERDRSLYPDFAKVRRSLTDDHFLFTHYDGFVLLPLPETAEKIKAMQIPLGRIDAVYARF
jgi:hypothetical protein